jgi:hypothetical protein
MENLKEHISYSLEHHLVINETERSVERLSLEKFLKILKEKSNMDLQVHFIDLIDAFLNGQFGIELFDPANNSKHAYVVDNNLKILHEPNKLLRFIQQLDVIILMINEIFPDKGPLERLKIAFGGFRKKKVFQFLKLADIDLTEKIILITILKNYIDGNTAISLDDACKYLPKSLQIQFEYRIHDGVVGIINQNLIKTYKELFATRKYFLIQPRLLELMSNQSIELL